MITPARAGAFVIGAVGVTGGLGSGTAWLYGHVSATMVYFIGLGIAAAGALIVASIAFVHLRGRYKLWQYFFFIVVQIFALGLLGSLTDRYATARAWEYTMAYAFVASAVLPILWLSYQVDNANHKECRMCCERIKVRARICRYCGSRTDELHDGTPQAP